MKKIISTLLLIMLIPLSAGADLTTEHEIQTKIDKIGTNILNSNKVQTHIVFTYDKNTRKSLLKTAKGLKKNQIIIYDGLYQCAETDDELAAILSRQIFFVSKFCDRFADRLNAAKSQKFYELILDKKAVDYMVKAGYNPLSLITYLNKTNPEYKFSLKHNRTSERLVAIYEYILQKYPQYLENDSSYSDNPYYQNFLLNTVTERKLLYKQNQQN